MQAYLPRNTASPKSLPTFNDLWPWLARRANPHPTRPSHSPPCSAWGRGENFLRLKPSLIPLSSVSHRDVSRPICLFSSPFRFFFFLFRTLLTGRKRVPAEGGRARDKRMDYPFYKLLRRHLDKRDRGLALLIQSTRLIRLLYTFLFISRGFSSWMNIGRILGFRDLARKLNVEYFHRHGRAFNRERRWNQ